MVSPARRLFLCLSVLAVAHFASAEPEFWDTLQKTYMIQPGTDVFKAKCLTCHIKPPIRNAYGNEVAGALGNAEKVTAEMLHSLDKLDTDNDGVSNGDELAQGHLPAVANSTTPDAAPKSTRSGLIPNHSFHPLLVHFPLGIFLFGGFLDFLGKRTNRENLRDAATWNLSFGALAALTAFTTGLLARWRMGMPIEGTVQIHLILAITALILTFTVAALKLRGKANENPYWLLLALSCGAVAATGHFGSILVHG